jgi:hypothetical protein
MSVHHYPDGTTAFVGERATRFYRLIVLRTLLRFEVAAIPGRRNPFPAVERVLEEFDRLPKERPRRRSDRARLYIQALQEIINSERTALQQEPPDGSTNH